MSKRSNAEPAAKKAAAPAPEAPPSLEETDPVVAEVADPAVEIAPEGPAETFAEALPAEPPAPITPPVEEEDEPTCDLSPRAKEYLTLLLTQYVGEEAFAKIRSKLFTKLEAGKQAFVVGAPPELVLGTAAFHPSAPDSDLNPEGCVLHINRRLVDVRLFES